MKEFLFYIIIFTTTLNAQYNKENQSVDVIPYWNKDNVLKYKIIETKITHKQNDTINKKSNSYDLKISVLDSTANSYTLKWETNLNIPDDKPEIKNYIDKNLKELNQIQIIYKTDEFGTVQEIINKKEIKKTYKKVFDLLLNKSSLGEKELKMIYQFIENDEYFNNYLMQDLNQFHLFYGLSLNKTEQEDEINFTNPITQSPMLLKQRYRLINIDEENEIYILSMSQTVDENQFLEDFKTKFGKDFDKDIANPNFNINVLLKQTFNNSGIILNSTYNTVVDYEGTTSTKLNEFILK